MILDLIKDITTHGSQIYIMMSVAIWKIWISYFDTNILKLYFIHLFFNSTWSVIFFGFHHDAVLSRILSPDGTILNCIRTSILTGTARHPTNYILDSSTNFSISDMHASGDSSREAWEEKGSQ